MVSNTTTANQLTSEYESALSEILPDLYQLLQFYEVSRTFEFHLVDLDQSPTITEDRIPPICLSYWDPVCRCYKCKFLPDQTLSVNSALGIDPEKLQQFCADLASKLSTSPRLSQFALQTDENFEVHISIDPITVNNSYIMSCRFVNGVLVCSNQPQ